MKHWATLFTLAMAWSIKAAETPLPGTTGPIPVTADSHPELAANRTQSPADLSRIGYVEEEFFVSGSANIYTWRPDGSLAVKTPNAPYTTRILVRRPTNPSRFSGTVVVELLNEARGYDWSFVWALSHDHFTARGDAFVGITHVPENIDALKKFDAKRYAPLSFANPTPGETCGARGAATSSSEEGLRWDMIGQVGALLKNKSPGGPMAGFNVERLYLTSHHGHAATYAIAIHSHAQLSAGKPVYDGYLLKSSDNPVRLSRCDAAPPNGDPRQVVRNIGVPVIRVVAQGEILRPNTFRRDDSDEPNDRFRLYEVPGAPRMDKTYFDHLPDVEDQIKSGQPATRAAWPFDYHCAADTLVEYPAMQWAVDAALEHLDRWTRAETVPPRAERIAVKGFGATGAAFENDAFGNAKGGVRNPYIDAPLAVYAPSGPGQCTSIMTEAPIAVPAPFDGERLAASIDRLQKGGWITAADAAEARAERSRREAAPNARP